MITATECLADGLKRKVRELPCQVDTDLPCPGKLSPATGREQVIDGYLVVGGDGVLDGAGR